MSTDADEPSGFPTTAALAGVAAPSPAAPLPTTPCSVVWSRGHAYVLEPTSGRSQWIGVDDRGRPQRLSRADLQRRGWSRTRAR
jgi:hypothetical protein